MDDAIIKMIMSCQGKTLSNALILMQWYTNNILSFVVWTWEGLEMEASSSSGWVMALRPVLIHEKLCWVDTHIDPHCLARKFVGKELLIEAQFLSKAATARQGERGYSGSRTAENWFCRYNLYFKRQSWAPSKKLECSKNDTEKNMDELSN